MELTHPRRPVDGSDAYHVFAIAKTWNLPELSGGVGTAVDGELAQVCKLGKSHN